MKLEEEVNKFMENKNKSTIMASTYQSKAKETAIFPRDKALEYLSLGLVGESGEIANKIKKIIRDNIPSSNWKTDLPNEIGDVLWYCAMLADYLDSDLGKIMENNLEKLQSRKKRGVLGGSGDNR
tara:strand:- start:7979 stop:8353 length:375 start_codon:yes stop_codon:yes gene_type:complete